MVDCEGEGMIWNASSFIKYVTEGEERGQEY